MQTSTHPSRVIQASWEYMMPQRKERMAGYIRESDPNLAESTTIDSAAKAVRVYGEKQGYIYEPTHEYKEAISAYMVPYFNRPRIMDMLAAAKRHEFDVLVITEVRAISRRGAGEVFIIYETLQKCGVRLETISEKFSDDPTGELVLTFKAVYAKLEREQSYLRMQRGKKDRIELSKAPPGTTKPPYGYIYIDTAREVKGAYEFNTLVTYVDHEGKEWSEYTVCLCVYELLLEGASLHSTARRLNALGIPPPSKPRKHEKGYWSAEKIRRLVEHPIYCGDVYVNRYKRVGKRQVLREEEEWILLPKGTAPAIIEGETMQVIRERLKCHKQDSLRNNNHPKELGLLRAGYIYCGICDSRMTVHYPSGQASIKNGATPVYRCQKRAKGDLGIIHNHRTQIHVPIIDRLAWEKVVEALQDYGLVRTKVAVLREMNAPVVNRAEIEEVVEKTRHAMKNLYRLAEQATDDETIMHLTQRMNELEKQKRETEALLYDIDDKEGEQKETEAELVKFEEWAEKVRPQLTDPTYKPTYEEKRLALRILGIKVTIFPTKGDFPYRYKIEVTIPEIMARIVSQPIAGLPGRLAIHEVHVCSDG